MKMYSKIALVVAVAIFLSMAACNRAASTAPVVFTPTGGAGEVPFPVDPTPTTGSIADFGTQTAVAQEPQAETTPQVIVNTPTAGEGNEQGGGQDQPAGQEPAQPAAPTAAAPVVNTPVVERPATYTLQRGEWPICIARRFDLDLSSFLALNGMNMNSQPSVGTVLQIPSTGSWSANYGPRSLRAHPTDYTAATGDTVYTVACQFGDVTPQAIQAVNNLGDTTTLTAGTTIRIP